MQPGAPTASSATTMSAVHIAAGCAVDALPARQESFTCYHMICLWKVQEAPVHTLPPCVGHKAWVRSPALCASTATRAEQACFQGAISSIQ